MKLIKLTDEKDQSKGNTQWGPGVEHTADGKSKKLCNHHWLHAYRDVYVALLLAPTHVQYTSLHIWEAEGDVGLEHADKCGCTRLKTIRRIEQPEINTAMRVEFARLVALEVYPLMASYDTNKTVYNWLTGKDKTMTAADAAAEGANSSLTPERMVELAHKACKQEM